MVILYKFHAQSEFRKLIFSICFGKKTAVVLEDIRSYNEQVPNACLFDFEFHMEGYNLRKNMRSEINT